MTPLLEVRKLTKIYGAGPFRRRRTFALSADFSLSEPQVVGVLGPNGSGKTTLFELLAGSNTPTGGQVLCNGQDVHRVKYRERDRLVVHYHQSYQIRRTRKTLPNFMLDGTSSSYPLVHIFDEPQFSVQDGYVGFMLKFFERLRKSGRVVILCVHPCEQFQLDILRERCARYFFVSKGEVREKPDYASLLADPDAREYLSTAAAAAFAPHGHEG
jgi:ABC-type branched-subunit amino acid transport system ATPase component